MKRTLPVTLAICVFFLIAYAGCGGGGSNQDSIASPAAILSCTPANGDTKIGVGSKIVVTFSNALRKSSLNWKTFRVIGDSVNGKSQESGSLTYNSMNFKTIFEPTYGLLKDTHYTVILSNIRDTNGSAVAGTTVSFTTSVNPPMISLNYNSTGALDEYTSYEYAPDGKTVRELVFMETGSDIAMYSYYAYEYDTTGNISQKNRYL